MSSFVNFIRGRTDNFPLNIQYIRVGKAEAFLESANSLEYDVVWNVEEVKHLDDLHIPKMISEEIDAYVLNLELDEENLDDFRRAFWNKLIWTDLPPLPLAIVVPAKKKAKGLDESAILAGLSLIRLTDRPWKLFFHGDDLAEQLMSWLVSISSSFLRGFEKKAYIKEQEALEREKHKATKKIRKNRAT